MWTDSNRAQYARADLALPSDLTDAEWALLESFFPPPSHAGRPRKNYTITKLQLRRHFTEYTNHASRCARELPRQFTELPNYAAAGFLLTLSRRSARRTHPGGTRNAVTLAKVSRNDFPARRPCRYLRRDRPRAAQEKFTLHASHTQRSQSSRNSPRSCAQRHRAYCPKGRFDLSKRRRSLSPLSLAGFAGFCRSDADRTWSRIRAVPFPARPREEIAQ